MVVGGHSLGGVMAARYTFNQAEKGHGLVLMAAYPESNIDLRGLNLPVVTIDGERDGLTSVDDIEHSLALLPAKTRRVLINGGNHAQFGWYGNQSGDDQPGQAVFTSYRGYHCSFARGWRLNRIGVRLFSTLSIWRWR